MGLVNGQTAYVAGAEYGPATALSPVAKAACVGVSNAAPGGQTSTNLADPPQPIGAPNQVTGLSSACAAVLTSAAIPIGSVHSAQ